MSLLRGRVDPGRDERPEPVPGGWAKRALDVVVAATGIAVLGPLMLAILLLIRLTSPGPALFRQTRIGIGRQPFVMYKFRTMRPDADPTVHLEFVRRLLAGEQEAVDGLYKLDGDDRITKVGAFLRRTSLDELPQLVNVLRGHMSVVGPRPVLPTELTLLPDWADPRFRVLPGVTGLWQVSGRNRLTMLEGLAIDVDYAVRRSVWLDVMVILRTVPALLSQQAR